MWIIVRYQYFQSFVTSAERRRRCFHFVGLFISLSEENKKLNIKDINELDLGNGIYSSKNDGK